jgi:hypothetical protein
MSGPTADAAADAKAKAAADSAALAFHPIFRAIADRFWIMHKIRIADHIEEIKEVYWRTEEGVDFVPKSAAAWTKALRKAGFVHDKRDKHLGFIPSVGTFAALATTGEGYREPGSPSLHCAVASFLCKVHLDNVGFVLTGYTADAGQHIVDELGYQTYVVANVAKLSVPLASFLGRIHPIMPNSSQFKPFSAVGARFDVYSKRSRDQQRQVKLTVDFTHACSDITCGTLGRFQGKSFQGENQVMLNLWFTGL